VNPPSKREVLLMVGALCLPALLRLACCIRHPTIRRQQWGHGPDCPRFVTDAAERHAAAKLAVASSRLSGRNVPEWVRQLAEEPEPPQRDRRFSLCHRAPGDARPEAGTPSS
jgi:hypothetical protein